MFIEKMVIYDNRCHILVLVKLKHALKLKTSVTKSISVY